MSLCYDVGRGFATRVLLVSLGCAIFGVVFPVPSVEARND